MGVRIISGKEDDHYSTSSSAVLFCSTSDWAFGPVFYDSDDGAHDARERAEAFLRWLGTCEPRRMTDRELEQAYGDWRAQEDAQWKEEAGIEAAKWVDTPEEYAQALGWDFSHIEATARDGVAPYDLTALSHTSITSGELLAWCRARVAAQETESK